MVNSVERLNYLCVKSRQRYLMNTGNNILWPSELSKLYVHLLIERGTNKCSSFFVLSNINILILFFKRIN